MAREDDREQVIDFPNRIYDLGTVVMPDAPSNLPHHSQLYSPMITPSGAWMAALVLRCKGRQNFVISDSSASL